MERREGTDDTRSGRRSVVGDDSDRAGTAHVRIHGQRLDLHTRSGHASRAHTRSGSWGGRVGGHRGAAVSARLAASALVVLAFSARGACAQDSLVFKGADRETRAALASIVAEASARGLPTAPIVSKVQFALVVHAPSARIVA